MTLEMGKPLAESYGEVTYGAEFLRWFAEEAVRQPGRFRHAPSAEEAVLTVARPVGPSLLITDRKSTRLNSSHVATSYAVFCLKKKNSHSRCYSTKLRIRYPDGTERVLMNQS